MTDSQMELYGEPLPSDRNAQAVIKACCDLFAEKGIPLSTRYRGVLGKGAKELLEDGYEYETVVVAAVVSLRRGAPHQIHHIAHDLVTARAGERMTRRQFERALQDEMELR